VHDVIRLGIGDAGSVGISGDGLRDADARRDGHLMHLAAEIAHQNMPGIIRAGMSAAGGLALSRLGFEQLTCSRAPE